MEQRVSLITLGVADVNAAMTFYQRLGWVVGMDVQETVFFQAGGLIVTLWGREKLAADCGVVDSAGWGGIALAHNVGSRDEVHQIIDDARAAGAQVSREPAETFYGGYAGVFLDLDGHPWEVAHNPGFELREDGTVALPPATL
ncbi:MAG TPA: VOC family protein [Candidatus Dormibacteraeota bacterium]|nr:VOC family protein [Candidatus Dormibacteraeota bacterium]